MDQPKGEMTIREAGKRGGEARKAQLGSEGYSRLGQQAGQTTLARHGPEHYERIGKLGAAARAAQRKAQRG